MSLQLDKEDSSNIMSVYAPQTGCPEQDKDEFHLTLEDDTGSVPVGD